MTEAVWSLNGNLGTVRVLKEAGAAPRYALAWVGAWMQKDDNPSKPAFDVAPIDRHIKACQAEGLTPVFQSFYAGDGISLKFAKGEITWRDYHRRGDGTAVLKSRGGFWELNKEIARRAKALNAEVVVILETEWNKTPWAAPAGSGRIESEPAAWDTLFSQVAQAMRDISEGRVRVVSGPGSWADMKKLYAAFPKIRDGADIHGTQLLRSLPREGAAEYLAGPDTLLAKLKQIREVVGAGREVWVTDFAFSSYGGAFDTSHPFAGGTGEAGEEIQAEAWDSMVSLIPGFLDAGVTTFFMRGIRDADGMDVANYHGHSERDWGVIHGDGRYKLAYESVLDFAAGDRPISPAEYYAALARIAELEANAVKLTTDLEALTLELNQAKALVEAVAQVAIESRAALKQIAAIANAEMAKGNAPAEG